MEFRPSLIKDTETNQLIFQNRTLLRAVEAPLINIPKHKTVPDNLGCTVTWS